RRTAIAGDGDRYARAAYAGRGREMRQSQSGFARGRARLGILGDPVAKGRSHVGGRRTATNERPRRGRPPAHRGVAAGKIPDASLRREQKPRKEEVGAASNGLTRR